MAGPHDAPFTEEVCPECGQPKLKEWGATCGLCRVTLGQPRQTELVAQRRRGAPPLAFAWLVVVEAAENRRNGEVIPLPAAANVITRDGAVTGMPGEIVFRDEFLSAGHAQIKIELAGDLCFTLEDRRDPGPSSHGTFLAGRRLEPGETARLWDGAEIRVGATELVFRCLSVPGAPA